MGFDSWDSVYKRQELKPIDKFKNKSRLLKDFGPNAVRIYNAFDGFKTAGQIRAMLGLDANQFSTIIESMLTNKMVHQEGAQSRSDFNQPPNTPQTSAHPELSASHPLTPMEKSIFDQYGESGLEVYSLIDGHKTARQILTQTGISETKLVEILEFMNKKGIIKLDKPSAPQTQSLRAQSPFTPQGPTSSPSTPPSTRGRPYAPPRAQSKPAPGFSPMVETSPAPSKPMERKEGDDSVPVDVPSFKSKSFFSKAKANALAALKFGKPGTELLKKIDGTKDFVQLSIESEFALHDLDIILTELGKNDLIAFRQLERSEISHRYGDDGLAVYKKYGRDGILIYQLIGKANSLKDIILKCHLPTERAIDIIMFVHTMLGLDIPLDRDMIYRYIQQKKN